MTNAPTSELVETLTWEDVTAKIFSDRYEFWAHGVLQLTSRIRGTHSVQRLVRSLRKGGYR